MQVLSVTLFRRQTLSLPVKMNWGFGFILTRLTLTRDSMLHTQANGNKVLATKIMIQKNTGICKPLQICNVVYPVWSDKQTETRNSQRVSSTWAELTTASCPVNSHCLTGFEWRDDRRSRNIEQKKQLQINQKKILGFNRMQKYGQSICLLVEIIESHLPLPSILCFINRLWRFFDEKFWNDFISSISRLSISKLHTVWLDHYCTTW